jgi:ribosomal protein S18 acetylase RimI-like enzyme
MCFLRNGLKRLWDDLRDLVYLIKFRGRSAAQSWCKETLRTLVYNRIEYIVFTRSLEHDLPIFNPIIPFAIHLLREEELRSHRDFFLPSERDRFRIWLKHGRTGFGIFDQDHLMGYSWLSGQVNFRIEGIRLRLKPGDVYLTDAFVSPDFRCRGIFPQILIYQLYYSKRCGYKRAVLIVAEENIPSIKGVIKIGFKEADHMSFRRLLGARSLNYQRGQF